MDKCIEIYIPGITDEGIYFEGVSESNLFEIISNIVKKPSSVNGKSLQRLTDILKLMETILNTSETLSGNNLDFADIGDNIVGNSSIIELGKVLFRNDIANSTSLVPLFSLLSSNGFNISSSNVILTSDPKINNSIYLGNKYFKIVANPTKPDFISLLYKSLGFAYINNKLQSQSTITNVLNDYLSKILDVSSSSIGSGDENFDLKIKEILNLSENHKLRAFLTFILNESNIPESIKSIVDDMSIFIETDIRAHLYKHVEEIRKQREYGKEQYHKDSEVLNLSKANLERKVKELQLVKNAIYYHKSYKSDSNTVAENKGKRINFTIDKSELDIIRDRKRFFDSFLDRNPDLLNVDISEYQGRNIDKELELTKSNIDNLLEIASRVSVYNRTSKNFNHSWNPYSLLTQNDFLENLIKEDLNFETISPKTIKFGKDDNRKTLSVTNVKKFLQGFLNKSNITTEVPTKEDLINILVENGVVPLEETIPFNRALRSFLADEANRELFVLFWDPKNHDNIDPKTFNITQIIEKIILEETIYLPYEDYTSDYSFDLRGLNIQSSENTFVNKSAIIRYKSTTLEKYTSDVLKVKFTTQKDTEAKIKKNILTLPINNELLELPRDVELFLKSNKVKTLYVDFDSNNNISPSYASDVLIDLVKLINNTPDAFTLSKFVVKGIDKLLVELSKTAADLGLMVQVFTDDDSKFANEFQSYNTKTFTNNIYYKFLETESLNDLNSSSLEEAFINREISGLLYNITRNNMGDTRNMAKLMRGNNINILFKSKSVIHGIVKDVIKFTPSKLFSKESDNIINIGSKVTVIEGNKRNIDMVLSGDYYVIKKLDDDLFLLSNGFSNFGPVKGSNLRFETLAQLIDYNGKMIFPIMRDSGNYIEAETGYVQPLTSETFNLLYKDLFERISKLTGYTVNYLQNIIKPENAYNFGVLDIIPVEDLVINSSTDKSISKFETLSLISMFADKLNSIVKGKELFVSIINSSMLQESGLSSYEYKHPAFIKDGKIYINVEHPTVHPGSLVHELSHLILGSIRLNDPDTYYKMLSNVDLESNKYNNFKVRYKNRLRSDIQEEVLADLFGKYFDQLILDYGSLEEIFENLSLSKIFTEMFNISEDVPEHITNSELMNMTINEAVVKTSSGYSISTSIFDNNSVAKLRKVSNLKENLYKDKKLTETCE